MAGAGVCTCQGVHLPGVYLPGGVPVWRGVPAQGGVPAPGGVPALGGGYLPGEGGTCPGTPPPCEQNDCQTGVKT